MGYLNSQNITENFLDRIMNINDPLATAITVHLMTENWIDRIIDAVCITPGQIKKWNYSAKLLFIYNFKIIEEPLYKNLRLLNKLRNDCAHNLDYNFNGINIKDYNLNGIKEKLDNTEGFEENAYEVEDVNKKLFLIGLATFGWLHNLMVIEYER